MSFNHYDQFELLKKINLHHPDLLLKLASSKDLFERLNFIIEKLGNIYIKYFEPYNMGYQSANKKSFDLSQIYQFQLCRPTFSELPSESSKNFILRAEDLFEKLGMLTILTFVWILDLMERLNHSNEKRFI